MVQFMNQKSPHRKIRSTATQGLSIAFTLLIALVLSVNSASAQSSGQNSRSSESQATPTPEPRKPWPLVPPGPRPPIGPVEVDPFDDGPTRDPVSGLGLDATKASSASDSDAADVDWASIRGVNYIAAYAASPYEMWLDYSPEAVRIELARARRIGFNSVRVQLSFRAFDEKPTPVLDAIMDFVAACAETGLTTMPVFFDARGIDPAKALEGAEGVKTSYERFAAHPDAYHLRTSFKRFAEFPPTELIARREVPKTSDPGVLLWGAWQAEPANGHAGQENWDRCANFVVQIISKVGAGETVIAWDIMNQPDRVHPYVKGGSRLVELQPFILEMIAAARAAEPVRPLTVTLAGAMQGATPISVKLDFIGLSLPQAKSGELIAATRATQRIGRGRPIVLTDGGGVLYPKSVTEASEAYQKALVRETVLALDRRRVGFYLWHLSSGKAMTPWAGLIKENGSRTSAAKWLADWFGRDR